MKDQLTKDERDELLSAYSDDYKDLYGRRPLGPFHKWNDRQLQAAYNHQRQRLDAKLEAEAEAAR